MREIEQGPALPVKAARLVRFAPERLHHGPRDAFLKVTREVLSAPALPLLAALMRGLKYRTNST